MDEETPCVHLNRAKSPLGKLERGEQGRIQCMLLAVHHALDPVISGMSSCC